MSDANVSDKTLLAETPVSPVAAAQQTQKPHEYAAEPAGGLLGSPRPETPVSPVTPAATPVADTQLEAVRTFFEAAKAAETVSQMKRASLSATVFSIMQYEVHPDTGEAMITQAQIDQGLSMDSIKRYAYAWHDLDRFDAQEAAEQQGKGRQVAAGALKPRHVHLVVQCDHDYTIRQISNWFMVPAARVKVPRELAQAEGRKSYLGNGAREKAFFDLCQYLTHEGSKQRQKHQYDRATVVANFDFGAELDDHMASRAPGSKSNDQKQLDSLMLAVMHGEMSLREVRRDHPIFYGKYIDRFTKWRGDFLHHQPAPPHRICFYFEGQGGVGKDLLAKALARTLVPGDWVPGVHDPFFTVGGENVTWQGYDGQPVVIFEEARVENLIHSMGRKELFTFMNPFPEKQSMNVKYGSTQPVNTITIFTGPDPYDVFLDGLAGEYVDKAGIQHKAENKAQSRRRVPFIIPVREGEFDLLVNKGFADNTREFHEYYSYRNLRQNIEQVQIRLKGISDAPRRIETHLAIEAHQVAPIKDQFEKVLAAKSSIDEDPQSLILEFAELGKPIPEEEIAQRALESQRKAALAAAAEEARHARTWGIGHEEVTTHVA